MGLPPALHRKCCASSKSTAPPLPLPGPCLCIVFLSRQQIRLQVLPNKEFNFKKKIKIVSTEFLRARASPSTTPHPGFAHLYSGRRCAHTKPFRSWALRLLALSQLSFPSNWQARKDDRTCVCRQKAGLNWLGGQGGE